MKRTLLTGLFILAAAVIVSRTIYLEAQAVADKPALAADFAHLDNDHTHGSDHEHAESFDPFTSTAKKTRTVPVTVYVPTVRDNVIVYATETREVAVAAPESEQRSQRYSALMLQKAQRMTDSELDAAIDEAKADIAAADEAAQTELQQAIGILEEIVETSAGTPAAHRAEVALQVLKAPRQQLYGTQPLMFEE